MTALKLTEFDPAATLVGDEQFGFVQNSGNVKATLNDLATFIALFVSNIDLDVTTELILDTVGGALVEGTGITIVYDDANDTITLSTTITQYTDEQARDAIGAALVEGTGTNGGVEITVDDAGDTITVGLLSSAFLTLTDAATIAWDMSLGYNAKVTLGGNRAIGTPTNPVEGRSYSLMIIQDGTGSRTISDWGDIDFGEAGAPTLSTGAGKIDVIYMQCIDAATPVFRAMINKSV